MKWPRYINLLGITLLALLVFSPSLFSYFASDDFEWLAVSRDRDITEIFTTNTIGVVGGGNYNPIVSLYFWSITNVFGVSPAIFHLFSIFFHLTVVFLLYHVIKSVYSERVALLGALFFAVYFNHAETVNWVAAIPHIFATIGVLASILFFLKKSLPLSLVFFALALLSKEIAITLPIILFMVYLAREKWTVLGLVRFLPFALILTGFLFLRDQATTIALGYYGKEQFEFEWQRYIKNVFTMLFAFFTTGKLRELILTAIHTQFLKVMAVTVPILAIAIPPYVSRFSRALFPTLLFFILLIPYIPLYFSTISNEGERYLYLPMTALALVVGLCFDTIITKSRRLGYTLFVVVILTSSLLLLQKSIIWMQAGKMSQQLVEDFGQIVALNEPNAGIIFLNLPDHYRGAQVMRNAMEYAIALRYPEYPLDAVIPRVRTMVPKGYLNESLIRVEFYKAPYEFILKTRDESFNLTGYDRRESTEMVFELWGYDYNLSTSSMAYFRIEQGLRTSMTTKPIHFLYFDAGRLQELELN